MRQKQKYTFNTRLRQTSVWSLALLCAFMLPLLLQVSHGFLHHHEAENCHHETTEVVDACHLKTHHKGLDKTHECGHKSHIDKTNEDFCDFCDLFFHTPTLFVEYFSPTISLSVKNPFYESVFSYQLICSQDAEALKRNKSPPSI
jgi:hypothetical protein